MHESTWRSAAVAVLAALAGCTGGQTGESPIEDDDPRLAEASCEALSSCPSADRIAMFDAAFGGMRADFQPALSVAEAVTSYEIAAVGRLVAVVQGRKAFLGTGTLCDDETEEGPEPCTGTPNATKYSTYVDMVVRTDDVLKGQLDVVGADLHVERPWPNDLPIDELVSLAPTGARLIVLGEPIGDVARDEAQPLVDVGLAPPDSIPDNLLASGPYGVTFEDADGIARGAGSYGEDLSAVYEGQLSDSGDVAGVRFDELVDAVRRTADAP